MILRFFSAIGLKRFFLNFEFWFCNFVNFWIIKRVSKWSIFALFGGGPLGGGVFKDNPGPLIPDESPGSDDKREYPEVCGNWHSDCRTWCGVDINGDGGVGDEVEVGDEISFFDELGDKSSLVDEVGDSSPVNEFVNEPKVLVTFKLLTFKLATFVWDVELAANDLKYSANFARWIICWAFINFFKFSTYCYTTDHRESERSKLEEWTVQS